MPIPDKIAEGLGNLVVPGIIAGAQAITRGGPRRQYEWNKRAAEDANRMNRENALWALEENKRLQQEQRVYDSPEAQMARYKAAGLNPHLLYGSGSSAGSAFPISTQGIAPSRIDAPSASYPDIAGSFLQAGQTLAATELSQSKTAESGYKQEALSIQNAIARANPMLDAGVAEWVRTSTEETARLKAIESRQWLSKGYGEDVLKVQQKVNGQLEELFQKIGLNTTDQAIRNKILESKEFENAIKAIQVNWLKDGEVTPQHIYQAILLMLTKMM